MSEKEEQNSKTEKYDNVEVEVEAEDINNKEDTSDDFIKSDEAPQDELESHNCEDEKTENDILREDIDRLRDEKLRLLAEMDNLRKRSDRDRIDSIRYGSFNFARDILSSDDNLRRALEAIPQEKINSENINNLIDGLKMVQKEFSTILEKHGVKKIDSLNKKFDHNYHQAMVEIEDDNVESGMVIQEIQSGYTMHEKLLRPSMVGVSKKTTKNKENEE